MESQPAEPTAIFHERGAMEEAVRALVDEGIPARRIRISQGGIRDGDKRIGTDSERGSLVLAGIAIGAVSGGALALVWIYWLSALVAIPPALVALRVLGGAARGALVGGLLSILVIAAHREPRRGPSAKPGDFIVSVKLHDDRSARAVGEFLALHGGDLEPTSPWDHLTRSTAPRFFPRHGT